MSIGTLYKNNTRCITTRRLFALRLNATDIRLSLSVPISADAREANRQPILPNWALLNANLLSVAEMRQHLPLAVLPKHLGSLFASIQSKRPTRADIMVLVVYAFGLESGFASFATARCDSSNDDVVSTNRWWSTFNNRLVQRFAHDWPDEYLANDEEYYEIPLELIGTPSTSSTLLVHDMGDSVCITLTSAVHGRSVCLPLSTYVVSTQVKRLQHQCFKSLKLLGKLLRNQMFVPVRNRLLASVGLHYPGLDGLPDEIRLLIYQQLDLPQLQIVSHTCQKLRAEIQKLRRVQNILPK